jgi:hypothetical protein
MGRAEDEIQVLPRFAGGKSSLGLLSAVPFKRGDDAAWYGQRTGRSVRLDVDELQRSADPLNGAPHEEHLVIEVHVRPAQTEHLASAKTHEQRAEEQSCEPILQDLDKQLACLLHREDPPLLPFQGWPANSLRHVRGTRSLRTASSSALRSTAWSLTRDAGLI